MNTERRRALISGLRHRIWLWLATTLAFAGALPAHASWTLLGSGTSVELYGVDAVDAATAFAVGDSGTILKTTDGGASWKKQRSGVRTRLQRVQFLDSSTGYVAGVAMLKTENGGADWQTLALPTTEQLFSLYFVNTQVGFVGGHRTLLKTTDGGLTWSTLFLNDLDVMALQFDANGLTGYAAATDWGSAYLYKTVDGGATWVQQLWLDGGMARGLHFPADTSLGYFANQNTAGAEAGVYKTTDGGATWSRTGVGPASDNPMVVRFTDAQTGVAVGYRGVIFRTTDGGANWSEGWIGQDTTLNDLDFADAATGYLVGAGGLIAKTGDGGAPSIRAAFLHPIATGSLYSFTEQVGCATAHDCVNDQPGNAPDGSPVAPNSLDYVADSAGNRAMFALGNGLIPAGHRAVALRVYLAATQYDGPYASLGYQRVGIDGAPIDSPSFWLANYWLVGWNSWGWTGLNWTPADVDALEVGVKTVAGQRVEAGQVFAKIYYEPAP